MNITEQTRVMDLTVGQLLDLFKNMAIKEQKPIVSNYCNDGFIHGYAGLADFLKCSKYCVYSRIKSGKYKKAIIRNGKKIIFKKAVLMEILENQTKTKSTANKQIINVQFF